MPREIKVIFRLIKQGHITDLEAFRLLWALFVGMTGYQVTESCEASENLPAETAKEVEVIGFGR